MLSLTPMTLSSLTRKPFTLAAFVFVLLGLAAFLTLPLIFGSGGGYPLAAGDRIAAWQWQGPYRDGGAKEKQVTTDIAGMKQSLGKEGTSDYDAYVGLAAEYELLGDGKNAYQYLSKAIALEPAHGLAYLNMGHLMEELGALHTAHTAYDQAVAAEPTNPLYQSSRSDFLLKHPGN